MGRKTQQNNITNEELIKQISKENVAPIGYLIRCCYYELVSIKISHISALNRRDNIV